MEIKNKYYVGSNSAIEEIRSYGLRKGKQWACETEEEAIEIAKQVLLDDPTKKFTFVVKIIKLITFPETPIVVRDL